MENLIKFYNACFQADNNSLIVSNFFGTSVENRYIFDEEQLVNGNLPYYPVDEGYAIKTDKTAKIYEKEKEFVYCSLFIIGKTLSFNNRISKICSPLIIHPAKIIRSDDLYFVGIDKSERRVNYSLLSKLRENETDNELFYERIHQLLYGFDIDDTTIFGLTDIFKTFVPELNVEDLSNFPALYKEDKIKTFLTAKFLNELDGYKIIPASAAGIIKRSVNTRGIINELNEMAKVGQFSNPMKVIFENKEYSVKTETIPGKVPAILNNTQKKVLKFAPTYPTSLIYGPPGTGKTYTIAALAVEQMTKGKSILIASGTDQAVDVIADKIEEQLGIKGILVRGGSKQYLKDLKNYLQNILFGIKGYNEERKSDKILSELTETDKIINSYQKRFNNKVAKEIKRGKFIYENISHHNFFKKVKKNYIKRRNEKDESLSSLIEKLQKKLVIHNELTKEYISSKYAETVNKTIYSHRDELRDLNKAIRTRKGSKQAELFRDIDFKIILKVLPVWLVRMNDINRILPLYRELFDIAIIDEATQCNIASSIPIIQRAKHVLFTGDPNQLRHVSFLSKARTDNLIDKYSLHEFPQEITDYKHNSILDLAGNCIKSQDQIFYLNEHFRSYPSIIRFSNMKFYSGSLKIMKSRPDISYNEGTKLINCKGKRLKQGYNKEEAEAILTKLKEIIALEESIDPLRCHSIGILSPFRNQTEYISELIKQQLTTEQISKHNIRISTAYGFQGDERDIMFLSFVLDNKSHSTAFRHINNPQVFNVSITRAKTKQYIYHSLEIGKILFDSILREYLESFTDETMKGEYHLKDDFIEDVVNELHKLNLKTWKAFPVANLNIDIITKVNDRLYGIDLIGFPGEFEEAFSLERYKMLQRAGLKTIPLAYTRWVNMRNESLYELKMSLKL